MARKRGKDPHAQALNSKRNAKMSPERRSEVARHAATARWAAMSPEERSAAAKRAAQTRRKRHPKKTSA